MKVKTLLLSILIGGILYIKPCGEHTSNEEVQQPKQNKIIVANEQTASDNQQKEIESSIQLKRHTSIKVVKATATPDGKSIVLLTTNLSKSNKNNSKLELYIWEINSRNKMKTITLPDQLNYPNAYPEELAVSPDGKYIAIAEWSGKIRLLDFSTGKEMKTLEEKSSYSNRNITFFLFSPDSKYVVSGTTVSYTRRIKVWEVETEKETYNSAGQCANFTNDSKYLLLCSEKEIKIIDIEKWQETRQIQIPPRLQYPAGIATTSDGKYILVVDTQSNIGIISFESGKWKKILKGTTTLAGARSIYITPLDNDKYVLTESRGKISSYTNISTINLKSGKSIFSTQATATFLINQQFLGGLAEKDEINFVDIHSSYENIIGTLYVLPEGEWVFQSKTDKKIDFSENASKYCTWETEDVAYPFEEFSTQQRVLNLASEILLKK